MTASVTSASGPQMRLKITLRVMGTSAFRSSSSINWPAVWAGLLPGGAAELPHAGAVAQVTKTQLSGILKGYRAARPDTQPGQQFLHGKGLDDIIICPRIKTGDFIARVSSAVNRRIGTVIPAARASRVSVMPSFPGSILSSRIRSLLLLSI